jgi:hypothetical protein
VPYAFPLRSALLPPAVRPPIGFFHRAVFPSVTEFVVPLSLTALSPVLAPEVSARENPLTIFCCQFVFAYRDFLMPACTGVFTDSCSHAGRLQVSRCPISACFGLRSSSRPVLVSAVIRVIAGRSQSCFESLDQRLFFCFYCTFMVISQSYTPGV